VSDGTDQDDGTAAFREQAIALLSAGRYAEALSLAETASHAQAKLARGHAFMGLAHYREAAAAFREAMLDKGAALEALVRLAAALAAEGELNPALEALDAAVAVAPQEPMPRFQRGMLRLQAGDLAGGWADYEARWQSQQFAREAGAQVFAPLLPKLALRLAPEDLRGQRILLLGEQGLGDQIMFASMIPELTRIARSVVFVCEPRLVRLFQASFPQVEVLSPYEARIESDSVDKLVALGSLGHALRRRPEDFPRTPYVAPTPQAKARWGDRLGPRRGLRVGLSWQGGLVTTRRATRSVSLDQLSELLALPGCEFVSLQYGQAAAEAAGRPILSFPSEDLDDFDDLAGLVANLDVVVSVQTALVHLCGGLGVDCLTLVSTNPGWRYMGDGETTPWYGSVRLLRQPAPGEWDPAVRRVAEALAAR